MPWVSTAVSVGGSLLGGAFGGSKEGERDAKDAAALANLRLDEAQRNAKEAAQPFVETGTNANKLLAQYLGIDISGYAPKPTMQQARDEVRDKHFRSRGKDYDRNSNFAGQEQWAKGLYERKLAEWEKGLEEWKANNPDKMGDGRLLRDFTNEDFVKDPGYDFRLQQGEQGIDRALAARGGRESGAALKAIARYNQDFGSNEFQNAFNRDTVNKNTIYSFLSGQSAQGLGAAQNNANLAFNASSQANQNNMNLSNTLLNLSNQRNENQQNAWQQAIANGLYGYERAKDRSVVGGGTYGTPPYVPSSGGYSTQSGGTPWYLA